MAKLNKPLADFTRPEIEGQEIGRISIGNEPLPITAVPPPLDYDKEGSLGIDDQLWHLIKERTIEFSNFKSFIDEVMCNSKSEKGKIEAYVTVSKNGRPISDSDSKNRLKCIEEKTQFMQVPFHSSHAYSVLKHAVEYYVKVFSDSGTPFKQNLNLEESIQFGNATGSPYLKLIREKLDLSTLSPCEDICKRFEYPIFTELIWSYWHEEGYLAQTMNAISRRFQNIQIGIGNALNHLDIDPLRPLSNILWGYIQDTQHRLTIPRRAYEYENHYGINLIGKAVKNIQPVNSRSGFIGAFNNLLNRCAHFYRERDNAIRRADGFPVLNALKEVHLILAEGAHNQFGDLPTVAKIEMLIEQWILSRPEVREFLGGKIMVPYSEPWMEKVDCMKNLQGWDKTSVNYYHDLAVFGEQLILSIRYTNWNSINQANFAAGWADFWRNEIQSYIHKYQVVTGVDLSADAADYTKRDYYITPAVLIKRRLTR